LKVLFRSGGDRADAMRRVQALDTVDVGQRVGLLLASGRSDPETWAHVLAQGQRLYEGIPPQKMRIVWRKLFWSFVGSARARLDGARIPSLVFL